MSNYISLECNKCPYYQQDVTDANTGYCKHKKGFVKVYDKQCEWWQKEDRRLWEERRKKT